MTMIEQILEGKTEFWQSLESLVGETCWGVSGAVGSMFILDFGKKVPRDRPIGGVRASTDRELFTGEFCFWVEQVARWVLFDNNNRISGSDRQTEAITEEIQCLHGQKLLAVSSSVNELTSRKLWFDHGVVLQFSNGIALALDMENDNEAEIDLVTVKSADDYITLSLSANEWFAHHAGEPWPHDLEARVDCFGAVSLPDGLYGHSVRIDLAGTSLENMHSQEHFEFHHKNEWACCFVRDGVFRGLCSAVGTNMLLHRFLSWSQRDLPQF